MTHGELKTLRQEGIELSKKGLFQEAQIKLYKAFNASEEFTEFHLEVGLDLVCVYRRMESYSAALDLIDYIAGHDFDSDYYVSLAYLDRALIEYRQRDYEKAIETIREAEALFDEHHPVKKFWYLSMVKGRVFFAQNQYDDAIACYSKALDLCHVSQQNIRNLQETYTNLGEVLIVADRIEEGVELIQKTLLFNQTEGANFLVAVNYQTLMYASFKVGDLKAAKDYASHCLHIAYKNNYRSIVRDVCYQIGRYYKQNGQPGVAEVFFRKASNADLRLSPELLRQLDIDIINSRGTNLGET